MMDYISKVLAEEERLRADFEAVIYTECDNCRNPILYGDPYFTDGYNEICVNCMDKFEETEA